MVADIRFPTDHRIDSTDTNEYAGSDRDETFWDQDLVDTEIADGDLTGESSEEDRPINDEQGYSHHPGE